MRISTGIAATALMAVTLAACGGLELDRARGLKTTGSAFDTALYQGYIERAEHEAGYGHHQSADAFALKAKAAAAGQPVDPYTPNDAGAFPTGTVPDSDLPAMTAGRQALMDVLAASARSKAPADAATAQVQFDCWVEEQSYIGTFFEDDQPDHAKACRDAFEAALKRAQAAVAPAPMVAKPAPAPAPVVAVPGNYLVFFDWDRATLTADARQVLTQAAANFVKGKIGRVQAVGHADTSGGAAYNDGLSQRRVGAVMQELVRLGVPANRIDIAWKGESDPLVVTGDGVREPQNRRVEITFEK